MRRERGPRRPPPRRSRRAPVVAGLRLRLFAELPDSGGDLAKTARPGRERGRWHGQRRRGARRPERENQRAALHAGGAAPRRSRCRISASTIGRARALAGGDGEDAQVAGEIAAVDGGHVARLQRLERARVVPVVEVSAVPLEIRSSSPGSPRAGRSRRACRSSRGRARPPSRAGRGPCWSARSGGPRRAADPPGSCRAAARCPRRSRRSRRSASVLRTAAQDAVPLVGAQALGRSRGRRAG